MKYTKDNVIGLVFNGPGFKNDYYRISEVKNGKLYLLGVTDPRFSGEYELDQALALLNSGGWTPKEIPNFKLYKIWN